MCSIYFIFCANTTHSNQKTIIELRHMKNAFTYNFFFLKCMYGAITGKAFNFSPAVLQMPSI